MAYAMIVTTLLFMLGCQEKITPTAPQEHTANFQAISLDTIEQDATYDIRGTWRLSFRNYKLAIKLKGSLTKGTVEGGRFESTCGKGSYTVSGKTIKIIDCFDAFIGTITDRNRMAGVYLYMGKNQGKWTAVRTTTSSSFTGTFKREGKGSLGNMDVYIIETYRLSQQGTTLKGTQTYYLRGSCGDVFTKTGAVTGAVSGSAGRLSVAEMSSGSVCGIGIGWIPGHTCQAKLVEQDNTLRLSACDWAYFNGDYPRQ